MFPTPNVMSCREWIQYSSSGGSGWLATVQHEHHQRLRRGTAECDARSSTLLGNGRLLVSMWSYFLLFIMVLHVRLSVGAATLADCFILYSYQPSSDFF